MELLTVGDVLHKWQDAAAASCVVYDLREFLVNLNYKFIPNSGPREQERHTALQTSFHETVMLVVHVFASFLLSFIFTRVRSFISLELEYSAHNAHSLCRNWWIISPSSRFILLQLTFHWSGNRTDYGMRW